MNWHGYWCFLQSLQLCLKSSGKYLVHIENKFQLLTISGTDQKFNGVLVGGVESNFRSVYIAPFFICNVLLTILIQGKSFFMVGMTNPTLGNSDKSYKNVLKGS